MNTLIKSTLKISRKAYSYISPPESWNKPACEQDPDKASDIIYNQLMKDEPCMIARFGSTELSTIVNYLGVQKYPHNIVKYIKGQSPQWWWNEHLFSQMQNWSGFFPANQSNIERFCELMLEDAKEVDVLGSWLADENKISSLTPHFKIELELLNPFFLINRGQELYKDKKILVIHPFAKLIQQQYNTKRKLLFNNSDVLPFFELETIEAVQSLGGITKGPFKDWFDALEWMKNKIDQCKYDICLIGAGAYGFPLAAHIKRNGKKAIHLGGSLQLLFGIKGARWENPNYNKLYNYFALMNESWVKPGAALKPANANNVEGGCYW